jgi:hypothetical protein
VDEIFGTHTIAGVFSPGMLSFIQPELTDLFIVEYLKQRPDMAALDIPRGAERLKDSLDHYRQRIQHMRASQAGGTE